MMKRLLGSLIPALCFFTLSLPVYASDLAKEQRWADQIVDGLLDGEAISLNDGQHDFLAILTGAESPRPTAVIVLHGIGIHPDWPQVVSPLRVRLAEAGWTTLSLQLPVLANEATGADYDRLLPEAAVRIRAGIDYLRGAGAGRVVIVGHSLGATMAAYAVAKNSAGVDGLVVIGMARGIDPLGDIVVPVLDLYGSNDLPGTLDTAEARRQFASANKAYSQRKIDGADHFFTDQDDDLVTAVTDWLADR